MDPDHEFLLFDQGQNPGIGIGATITGASSSANGVVANVYITSGSFGAGTAAGIIEFTGAGVSGGPFTDNENLEISASIRAKADGIEFTGFNPTNMLRGEATQVDFQTTHTLVKGITHFDFEFATRQKQANHLFDHTPIPNRKNIDIALKKVDYIHTFAKRFAESLAKDGGPFEMAMDYAISAWAKLPGKYSYILRWDTSTDQEFKKNWHWNPSADVFERPRGIWQAYGAGEKAPNNQTINSITFLGGR
jgi:hypothetical protein